EHPRRRGHPPGGRRPDRPRGQLPRDEQPPLRHERRRRDHAGQGRPGRRGRAGLQHLPPGGRGDRRQHGDDLRAAALCRRLDSRGRGRRRRDDRRDHRGHPGARRADRLQRPQAQPRRTARGPQLPRRAVAGQGQRRDHPGRVLQARQRRRRLALGNADLPDRQRAGAERLWQLDDRRHRRRPRPRLVVRRHHRPVSGRSRDRADRHERRDRRIGRGGGGAVHRRTGEQAGRRLHRRADRAAGQDDGPRGCDRVGLQRRRPGEDRRLGGRRRAGRADADAGRADRRRDPARL
ncbi:MAG: Succinyl-CoA ligase [ADP-forming] alpha chain, partial [uncultured Solirubrobacteraceae bacterium]